MERDEHWVNVTHDLTFLPGGEELLWSSERTGYRHIYRYRRDGTLLAQLTSGDWEVCGDRGRRRERPAGSTSPPKRTTGWAAISTGVALDGGARERITTERGTHDVTLNEQATAYLDEFSSMTRRHGRTLRAVAGGDGIATPRGPAGGRPGLVEPEIVELTAPDGALVRVKLYKPRELAPGAGSCPSSSTSTGARAPR